MTQRESRDMLPPGLAMGSAWFTDWLHRLPVLRRRARTLLVLTGITGLLALVAYNQWPRLQQPAGTQSGTVASYSLGSADDTHPTFSGVSLADVPVAQLPATFWAPTGMVAAVPQRQVYAHTVIAIGRNNKVALYATPEQIGGPAFVLQPDTLRHVWYSGWQVDVIDAQRGLRGTLYLSHLGTPRLIRAGQIEGATP
ncbi:hypothetical protein [Chitinolyticbacter meiyuanensis]|uniref:hypothetical protein n=1 Tax=Chitinolyticbacter meiyuanensis TaxID=682798 RepID=UPI0011E5C0B3|nr:hypothetical protein [Chitinolyticbacter meiyuanensis]